MTMSTIFLSVILFILAVHYSRKRKNYLRQLDNLTPHELHDARTNLQIELGLIILLMFVLIAINFLFR